MQLISTSVIASLQPYFWQVEEFSGHGGPCSFFHQKKCFANIQICKSQFNTFNGSLPNSFLLVLTSSHFVLCYRLFFVSRFLSSCQHSRWCAAPDARCCSGQVLPVISVGPSDRPATLEPVVHPESAGKHQRPRYPRKAAVRCPQSGSSSPTALARILDPSQSGLGASAAIHLLPPSDDTAADAERGPPQSRKGVKLQPGLHQSETCFRSEVLPPKIRRRLRPMFQRS